jgi:hypothetical protein
MTMAMDVILKSGDGEGIRRESDGSPYLVMGQRSLAWVAICIVTGYRSGETAERELGKGMPEGSFTRKERVIARIARIMLVR